MLVRSALAVVAAGVLAACTGADPAPGDERTTEDPTTSDAPARQLDQVTISVAEDELWVFGGTSGPDGSSPPVSTNVAPGWGPNDVMTAYGRDGGVRRQIRVPALGDEVAIGGQVFADDGDRYVLTSACGAQSWCRTSFDPVVVRIDDDGAATAREIDLPPAEDESRAGGVGVLAVLGRAPDGTVWAVQPIPGGPAPGVTQPVRFVAIDLAAAEGTVIDQPDGLFQIGTQCLEDGHLFSVQVELSGATPTAIRILRRPATTEPAAWELVADAPADPASVTGGSLRCLAGGALALQTYASTGNVLRTLSAVDASPVAPEIDGSVTVLGRLGDTDVAALTHRGDEWRVLVRHDAGGPWEDTGVVLPTLEGVTVFDGRLVDVRSAMRHTRPDGVAFPAFDLGR